MFLICDKDDVVQDVSTDVNNLSRGFNFSNYKQYEDPKIMTVFVGDTYKDGVLTPNEANRQKRELRAQQETLIVDKTRQIAIDTLKQEGKLPSEFE